MHKIAYHIGGDLYNRVTSTNEKTWEFLLSIVQYNSGNKYFLYSQTQTFKLEPQ